MRFELVTDATPDQVREALTDFSERRLRIWNRTLDPETFDVRALGDTWAVARESTPRSPFWVVLRYDWSDPEVVRWETLESSYGGGGSGEVRIAGEPGAGSRLRVEWGYTGVRRRRDRAMLAVIQAFPMNRMIPRLWTTALDDFARGA